MPKFLFKKRVLPDAGRVLAKLISIEEVENQFFNPKEQSGDKERQFEWTFEYEDKPGMEIKVWSTRSLSTYKGRKSKGLTIAEALLGEELTESDKEDFEANDLVSKKCYLTVKHEKKEDGQVFAKVIDFASEEK